MLKKPTTFGSEPQQLDRLLALGLENEDAESSTGQTVDSVIERVGGWIGPYRLLGILGEGGMGIVYLAEQIKPVRRRVALKIIKPGMDSRQVLARFETEQQALALMDHAHIARVHDAGLAPSGRPYFVMERVKGIPITEHCKQYDLAVEQRMHLFLHVCEAVQHAHQKGIIHRDLKPSNILVVVEGQEMIPKVIDFGVARAINQPLTERKLYTEQGQLIGTPEYMSPEQADPTQQDVDTRTDVYSLGILLYELLAGGLPFDPGDFRKEGIEHIRKVICEKDPQTPSTRLAQRQAKSESRHKLFTFRSSLSTDLDWITLKALEKDRTRRYATVAALADDIQRYLRHQTVSAVPPSLVYRARKLILRHRRQAAMVSMAVLLCVGLALAARMWVRVRQEAAHATALEHTQRLTEAQELFDSKRHKESLAQVKDLLSSVHVGRRAQLLHARLLLAEQGAGTAAQELMQLLDKSDEVAGTAHLLLANIYYNGDPCAPGGTRVYAERFQYHRAQAEQLMAGTASYYFLQARAAPAVKDMLALLAQALECNKQHYDSLRERALIYYSQHDYQKMARDAARMIGIRPDHAPGYALSALALREQGRYEEALQDHHDAIQLAPQDPRLYDARRETHERMGQYESALTDALRCVELRVQDLPYRHALFALYTTLGRYDEAQCAYEQFMAYPFLQEHHPGDVTRNMKDIFQLYSVKRVAESRASDRPWHGPDQVPRTAPYCLMHHFDSVYRDLCDRGTRLVPKGFHPSWSPDGTKLAYSHGLLRASGLAVLTVDTGGTELLTTSGRKPEWSPDGLTIAFERNRRIWSADSLADLNIRTWRPDGWLPTHAQEVWTVEVATREIRRICAGISPHWGKRSGRLYYVSPQEYTLYSRSLAHPDDPPVAVLSNCGASAQISPNERYVADQVSGELRIIDLDSGNTVATWVTPWHLTFSWSVDSRELSIGWGDIGLWIFDVATGKATKVLDGWHIDACWSPDHSRLAVTLLPAEIWVIPLDPNVRTVASFDTVQTAEEYYPEFMDWISQIITMDPAYMRAHYVRAQTALWMGHAQTEAYLREFERVLPPHNAADCVNEAQWMLDSTPELRNKLLPLALLLARKAVEKEPDNVDFLVTLGTALEGSQDRGAAEAVLLKAYNLCVTKSNTQELKISYVTRSIVKLYEAWKKPDEANKWRAKLRQIEAVIE